MPEDTTAPADQPTTPTASAKGSARKRKRSPWWAKLLLSLATFVLLLVLLELGLRISGARPMTATVLSAYFEPDANTGWRGRPNVSMIFEKTGFSVLTSHGPDGFRKLLKPLPPAAADAASSQEVWVFGDSFVWGWGVEDGKTFVDLLNETSGEKVFRNCGQAGFSSVQENILLTALLDQERPRVPGMVLILFGENDFHENMYAKRVRPPRPQYAIENDQPVLKNFPSKANAGYRFRVWIKKHSLAYNYLYFHAKRIMAGMKNRRSTGQANVPPQPSDRKWRVMRHVFSLIKERCDEYGIRLAVVYPADHEQRAGANPSQTLRRRSDEVRDRFVAMCGELDVAVIDMTGDVRDHFGRDPDKIEPLAFPNDGHPTRAGHRLIAHAIRGALKENR